MYDGELIELYLNGIKKFQATNEGLQPDEVQYYTENVPNPIGDISQASCFTGAFSVSVGYASSSSTSFDSGQLTETMGVMMTLMIAMLPLTIYVAVFKLLPKMLNRTVKF